MCSEHFKTSDIYKGYGGRLRLKRDAVPSIFEWTKSRPLRQRNQNKLQQQKIAKAQEEESSRRESIISSFRQREVEIHSQKSETSTPERVTEMPEFPSVTDENKENSETENTTAQSKSSEPAHQEQIEAMMKKIKELEAQIKAYQESTFCAENISRDSELLRFYTGFHSKEHFDSFFKWIEPYAKTMITWSQVQRSRGKDNHQQKQSTGHISLSLYNQYFLFMKRLRLGLFEADLGVRLTISKTSVSRITITWSNFLYSMLGQVPIWPTTAQIQKSMPQCFKDAYPKTKIILDCTEIEVQRPSSKVLNSEFYSSYKSHTTYKGLVGIAPQGAITFVSSLYQGSISDKEITKRSGVLDLLEEGDEVMADKGFLIQDLLESKKTSLTIPPFLARTRSLQFTSQQVTETQQIARLRIHVERAIRRVKEFQIFDRVLPLSLAGSINQLWTV